MGTLLSFTVGCTGALNHQDGLGGGGTGDPGIVLMDGGGGGGSTDTNASDTHTGADTSTGVDSGTGTDTNPPPCVPMCSGRECGADGCGGTCGTCGSTETCDSAGTCQPMSVDGCPPTGPFGTSPGSTAAGETVYACDGSPVSIHELCARRASLIYALAEWCPPCRAHVQNDIEREHAEYAAMGDFETWVLLTATQSSGAPTQADCNRAKSQYGIDAANVRFLFDRDGVYRRMGMRVNMNNMVMGRGNRIFINGPYAHSTVYREVQRAFSSTPP